MTDDWWTIQLEFSLNLGPYRSVFSERYAFYIYYKKKKKKKNKEWKKWGEIKKKKKKLYNNWTNRFTTLGGESNIKI